MAFAQASRRPIEGAVATLGVSDRVTFLRKTYAHLGVSLLLFAGLTGAMFKFAPQLTWKLSTMFGTGIVSMLILCAVLIFLMMGAERLAAHSTSRGLQYAGLGLGIALQTFMLMPLIWILMLKFSSFSAADAMAIRAGVMVPVLNGVAAEILLQATVITLVIFVGLTGVVFVTKKDFSFMRGALVVGSFAMMGVGLAAILFGFSLGALFSGFVVLLMAGWILYETSAIMKSYPPTAHVVAALVLFVTVATMFRAILRIMISLRSD
ncbi:MAG: Bax inhibitor-1 family protein [Deltaproteobacteria bacterium]|nr:Bax inhibitor-1 family protein [Deltaproteobacteria bacterium]